MIRRIALVLIMGVAVTGAASASIPAPVLLAMGGLILLALRRTTQCTAMMILMFSGKGPGSTGTDFPKDRELN